MATVYKTFQNNDLTSTRTLLHESIPLTGTLASGTYSDENIKNYSHGMFQSVYDYPYLSSSANHIYDLTFGYSNNSAISGATNIQNAKKINIYNQMAQVLVGFDSTGSIREFDEDGNITDGGTKLEECMFINFSRLLSKDEIKKGSFSMQLGTGSYATPFTNLITLADTNAENAYKVNSPVGEYGILSCSVGASGSTTPACGLIFYQAGVAVISSSVFADSSVGGILGDVSGTNAGTGYVDFGSALGTASFDEVLVSASISGAADNLRHRVYNISYNNTTELNSTIHFCRVGHNDFNYSSNPTYLSESKIRVKNNSLDSPVAYFKSVGLYSADNELLATAKMSEPLKKDPTNEMVVRVRLDY
jgi:hypothetical protein